MFEEAEILQAKSQQQNNSCRKKNYTDKQLMIF